MATTSTGQTLAITPGLVDDAAIHLYTRGQCAALAAALTEAGVGTPVFETNLAVSLDWTTTDDMGRLEAGAEHLLVRLPDGRLMDIEGVYDAGTYVTARTTRHSQCVLIDMDPQEFIGFVRSGAICDLDMVEQDVDLAATFVRTLVALYL